jgi:hypothetical protein
MDDESAKDAEETESAAERANRELIELLNELRVALPGVQVLFAFLLTVPFSQRYDVLDAGDRRVYFMAVLATVATTICLIAPTAHHRLRFRSGIKEQLLRVANIFAIVGLVLLAFAMSAVTYVITGVVYPGTVARIVTAVVVGSFAIVWFVLPVFYRPTKTPEPRAPSG